MNPHVDGATYNSDPLKYLHPRHCWLEIKVQHGPLFGTELKELMDYRMTYAILLREAYDAKR